MVTLSTVILAAGQGTRMRSHLPKVLHPLAGRPLLAHVLQTSQSLANNTNYVVYGHGGEQVQQAFANWKALTWIEQTEQLGTGHAVAQALPQIEDDATVLVLYGDVPLIQSKTLQFLTQAVTANSLAILTVDLEQPTGYGRIVRDHRGQVVRIVEEKDADTITRKITEVNTGILAAPARALRKWLAALQPNNAQSEYYLTDIIALAVADGFHVHTQQPHSEQEVLGVNDRIQLASLERYYQLQQAHDLMRHGVSLADPSRLDIRGEVTLTGQDIFIDVNVILSGQVSLGEGVSIGANCVVQDAVIGDHVEILPNSVVEDAVVAQGCHIGPFARLRPGTMLAEGVRVGNFVELKKADVGQGSKINHLSYIGDCDIGRAVNVGAGTITCNYDGVNKFKTTIGDGAFIGSDTQLVAPVTVGAGATIGAGSTITKDTPPNQLSLSRSKQVSFSQWQRPQKKT